MNIVVNPESNPELANELTELFSDFVPKAKVVRDNCIAINKELLNELFMNGYTPEIVSGLFLVDSYRNRLDPEDFTQSELVQVRDMFGNLSRQSLEKWVDTLPDQEREQYLLIPHVYLVLDGLILDASAGMFDTEITPDRYLDEDGDRIIK